MLYIPLIVNKCGGIPSVLIHGKPNLGKTAIILKSLKLLGYNSMLSSVNKLKDQTKAGIRILQNLHPNTPIMYVCILNVVI